MTISDIFSGELVELVVDLKIGIIGPGLLRAKNIRDVRIESAGICKSQPTLLSWAWPPKVDPRSPYLTDFTFKINSFSYFQISFPYIRD